MHDIYRLDLDADSSHRLTEARRGRGGAVSKYHETVTYAFVFLIHERMQRNPALTFDAFIATNEDLRVPILTRYYLPATLSSELAKATFVMPDRASA